jgi:adenylate cyclase
MVRCNQIVEWLVDGARSASDTSEVVSELCDGLVGCGIPISRFRLYVFALHPQIMGHAFRWHCGTAVEMISAPFETLETDEFRQSPIRHVIDTRTPLRCRLGQADCSMEFAVTRDLSEEGVTDYLAVPLFFAGGAVHGATFATERIRMASPTSKSPPLNPLSLHWLASPRTGCWSARRASCWIPMSAIMQDREFLLDK